MRPAAWRAALAALLACAAAPATGAPPKSFPDFPPLEAATAPNPDTAKIRAHFLGISTLLLDDGETQLLVDGFISRPRRWAVFVRGFKPAERKIDETLDAIGGQKIAAVLTAHAHYDHAMDAGYIAASKGAKLVGSESVAMIGDGAGVPEGNIWTPADREVLTCGRFKVTVLHGRHAKGNFYRGAIEEAPKLPARGSRYKASDSYAYLIENDGRIILIQPSANLPAGKKPPPPEADVVFLSAGMLGWRSEKFAKRYWDGTVHKDATQVIPIHWDDPTDPANERLRPTPLPERVKRALRLIGDQDPERLRLRTIPYARPVDLDLPPRKPNPATPPNPPNFCSQSTAGAALVKGR